MASIDFTRIFQKFFENDPSFFFVASLSAPFLARATVSPTCLIFDVFSRKFGGAPKTTCCEHVQKYVLALTQMNLISSAKNAMCGFNRVFLQGCGHGVTTV